MRVFMCAIVYVYVSVLELCACVRTYISAIGPTQALIINDNTCLRWIHNNVGLRTCRGRYHNVGRQN